MALTGIEVHVSPTSGNRSIETNRAEPVEGHETGAGRHRCTSDQQKTMAPRSVRTARISLPRMLLPRRMWLLPRNELVTEFVASSAFSSRFMMPTISQIPVLPAVLESLQSADPVAVCRPL